MDKFTSTPYRTLRWYEWLPEGRMTVMVLLDGSKQVQSFWDCDLLELSAEKKAA